MRRCILVVAREVALRAELTRLLMAAGHQVEIAEGDKRAREVLADGNVGMALLATKGFAGRGAALMRQFDQAGVRTILLTEQPANIDCQGKQPNDSPIRLCLPLDRDPVLAQVAAVLDTDTSGEASAAPALEITRFDGLTLDIDGRSVFGVAGREMPLARLEFALLVVFAQQPGRALSRN